MWWLERREQAGGVLRLAVVLAAASLTAGCFEPLYGTHLSASGVPDSVHYRLAAVDIPTIKAPLGSPVERIAVNMRNALQFDLNGGGGPTAPTHRLVVNVGTTQWTIVLDPISGRPDAQIDSVVAYYRLVEIATGKTVVSDSTFAHVDYDIPGREQRFAKQRAQRDAEDKATQVVAETIRNRLASYFVAGT
jgi:LPS-assembly lipoprotein